MKLIDNGLDSFEKAISKLFDLENKNITNIEYTLKDIIIGFHHALETLFKYLVENKNEYFIYEDLEALFLSEAEKNLKNKNNLKKQKKVKKTIQFMDSFNRVIVLYNIELDERVYKKIDYLNDLRNSITHYECMLEKTKIEHLITNILPTILKIFNENIEGFKEFMKKAKIDSNIKYLCNQSDIWKITTTIEALSNIDIAEKKLLKIEGKDMAVLSQINKNNDIVSLCQICKKNSFIREGNIIENCNITGEYGECKLCGYKLNKDAAILYYDRVYIDNVYKNTNLLDFIHNNSQDFIHNNSIDIDTMDIEITFKEFFEDSLKNFILDYEYQYGNESIEEIKICIIQNLDVFKKIVTDIIYENICDIIKFILKDINVDVTVNEEIDINFIIDKFKSLIPKDKVYVENYILRVRSVLKVYNLNTGEHLDYKNNRYTILFDSNLIGDDLKEKLSVEANCSYNEILNLNDNYIKNNKYNYYISDITRRKDYSNILDDIIYSTHNGNVWDELVNSNLCDFGDIEYVEVNGTDIEYIYEYEEDDNTIKIKAVFGQDISTKLYSDGEYIYNGSCIIHIKANILIDKTKDIMSVHDLELIS